MTHKYHNITDFSGGKNDLYDPKDIRPNQLSEAQNVAIDRVGRLRTVGALATHGEVPAQAAVICPGSGLKVFSSDHWYTGITEGDLTADGDATSDQQTEGDSVAGWTVSTNCTLDSDTFANFGIAAGTGTYCMEISSDGAGGVICRQTPAGLVAGALYHMHFSVYIPAAGGPDPGYIVATISTYTPGAPVWGGQIPVSTTGAWVSVDMEFVSTGTDSSISLKGTAAGAGELCYLDNVSLTRSPPRDMLGDWLALSDVANAQVDLYSDNLDAFKDGDDAAPDYGNDWIDFGTVSTYVATVDEINFPTTSTITDASGQFLNNGMQRGQVWKISGCTTETANNILIVIDRATAGTLYVRGTPLTVAADEDGTVTFTKYNPTAFHFVDEALRASPVGGGITLRPKHYSFVDRAHFMDADEEPLVYGDQYNAWYLNDAGPAAPTDQYVETTDSDGDRDITGDVDKGEGFEIAVTDNAAAGEWPAGTYEVATTFIYDNGQESALYTPATAQTFTATESSSQDVCVRAHNTGTDYDERISGGRAYCRITLSDDPWVLLVDIDMKQGARATLSGKYNAWADGTTAYVVYSDGFDSFRRNLDTYESLTGRDPGVDLIPFSSNNTFWDASVIAGNRCFLASARYAGAGGVTSYFRDRIIYSQVNQYDVFPIDNFIDVTRGDADDYVRLIHFNDRILAFKHRNLFVHHS